MKMVFKKVMGLIMVLLMCFTVPAVVFAEGSNNTSTNTTITSTTTDSGSVDTGAINVTSDDTNSTMTSDNETSTSDDELEVEVDPEDVVNENETAIISDQNGAQMRLLQLSRRVEAQIEGANEVILKLEENNVSDVNITRLNEIVENFEGILVEINETNFDQSADTLATEYVALKSDAIALTQEFRKIVGNSLTSEQKAEVKKRIAKRKQEVYENRKDAVEKAVKKFNAKRLSEYLDMIGVDGAQLKAQVESGNMTLQEAKKEVADAYKALSPEEKKAVNQKIAEDTKKKIIQAKEKAQEQKAKVQARNEVRKKIMKERFEKNKKLIQARVDNRIKMLTPEQKELLKQHREEVKTVIGENKDEIRAVIQNNREEIRKLMLQHRKEILELRSKNRAEIKAELQKIIKENNLNIEVDDALVDEVASGTTDNTTE